MTKPRYISLDVETRSLADLRECGVYKYAEHPSTDVWCVSYGVGGSPIRTWLHGDPFPDDLRDALAAGAYIRAWNAQFERIIWRDVLVRKHGWPALDTRRFVCSMVVAAAAGLPMSLEEAAIVLKLSEQKDAAGARLMMQMTKPRKVHDDGTIIWWEDDAKLARLAAYCEQDVRTESAIWRRLPPCMDRRERALYLLDQDINDRGVGLDLDLVGGAIRLAGGEAARLDAELLDLTGGSVTGASKLADLKRWVAARGVLTPTLDKAAVLSLLEGELPPDVRRALEIRAAAGKTSVAKYAKAEAAACADGRARGLLQFYGAGTGRWAGRLLQPQNYPRGAVKVTPEVIAAIKDGTLTEDVMETLSSALRGMFVPSPGSAFYVADFNAIEARVVAWLAGETRLLNLFASGGKVYETMAAIIFGVPVDEVTPEQRQVGKMVVLGCFGADTEVLTEKRGWVRIVDVTVADRVWDGTQWVTHSGVQDRGEREVGEWLGTTVTRDHLVWCGDRFLPVEAVASDASTLFLTSALEAARTSCLAIGWDPGEGSSFSSVTVIAENTTAPSPRRTGEKGLPPDAVRVPGPKPRTLGSSTSGTPMLCRTITLGRDCSPGSRRVSPDATIRTIGRILTTEDEESRCALNGGKIAGSSSRILSLSKGGMTRIWNWIASTLTGGTNPGMSGSSTDGGTSTTDERFGSYRNVWTPLPGKMQTFDLAYCGPNNRYLIRTGAGPLLVHNCGFGMGPRKFAAQTGVEDALAERAVRAYRDANARIPELWYGLNDAALRTVRTGAPSTYGKLRFRRVSSWLALDLPVGRSLWYHRPRIVEREMPWSTPEKPAFRDAVQVDVRDNVTRQWVSLDLYGGILAENATQAVARDLMAEGMLRTEAEGYRTVLTIHDELVSEADPSRDIEEFVTLLSAVPEWAAGCPIKAEGWTGERYRKG